MPGLGHDQKWVALRNLRRARPGPRTMTTAGSRTRKPAASRDAGPRRRRPASGDRRSSSVPESFEVSA
jgi:hypothetical protein